MKIFMHYSAKLLVASLVAFIFTYVFLIHPNDIRINFDISKSLVPIKKFKRLEKSLWLKNLKLTHSATQEELNKEIKNISRYYAGAILTNAPRFAYPSQVFVPLGNYPEYVDGRDAILIPSRREITIEGEFSRDTQLNYGVHSTEVDAKIAVFAGNSTVPIKSTVISGKSTWLLGRLLKSIPRWLYPDIKNWLSLWVDESIDIGKENTGSIKISCESKSAPCLVSGLQIFNLEKKTSQTKNILFILIDTMRADVLQQAYAPHMVKMLDSAIQFRNALAPGNMTSPSTNALLSCRLPTELGNWAFTYGVDEASRQAFYKENTRSFPDRFSEVGFSTAMIGNISVISEVIGVGVNHGFSQQIAVEFDGFDTPLMAREAIEWLKNHGGEKFFLYLHFNAPHAPYRAPLRNIWAVWPGFSVFRSYASILDWLYHSEVYYSDHYVNEVVLALKKLGIDDSTLVVVTADHGDQMKARSFVGNEIGRDFFGSYHDHGATLLNDEVHVPLFMHKADDSIRPKKIDDFVSTIQLGPTLADLFLGEELSQCSGLPLQKYTHNAVGNFTEGVKGLGAQANSVISDDQKLKGLIGVEGFQGRAIVFDGVYKYIRSYESTRKRVYPDFGYLPDMTEYLCKEQLYDLGADPLEMLNLAKKNSELLLRAQEL